MAQVSVGRHAPHFSADAVVDGEVKRVTLDDYAGQWLVLFFYPLDWTFVCPTEILEFSDSASNFRQLNTEVVGVSIDSVYSHLSWISTSRKDGGLGGKLNIPLIADVNKKISADYGALYLDSGHTLRATFIINPAGIVKHISLNDPPVGRSVNEIFRLVQGYQFHAEHGEVCPINWTPGSDTIVPDPVKKLKYFAKKND